jgi:hypothetical protein
MVVKDITETTPNAGRRGSINTNDNTNRNFSSRNNNYNNQINRGDYGRNSNNSSRNNNYNDQTEGITVEIQIITLLETMALTLTQELIPDFSKRI